MTAKFRFSLRDEYTTVSLTNEQMFVLVTEGTRYSVLLRKLSMYTGLEPASVASLLRFIRDNFEADTKELTVMKIEPEIEFTYS